MEASTSRETVDSHVCSEQPDISTVEEAKNPIPGGTFKCTYCPLKEHYDYKGGKPPFARQICFSEDSYVMKDPWSLPKRGEVLVIGGDCSVCNKAVCLSCSIFYLKRFCSKCANAKIEYFPSQLHSKIKSLETLEKS